MSDAKKRPDDPEVTRRREAWIDDVCAELGLDREVVTAATPAVLHMTAGVAHGPARPAAPLTAMLVGLAAARDGEVGVEAIRAQVERVEALLEGWDK